MRCRLHNAQWQKRAGGRPALQQRVPPPSAQGQPAQPCSDACPRPGPGGTRRHGAGRSTPASPCSDACLHPPSLSALEAPPTGVVQAGTLLQVVKQCGVGPGLEQQAHAVGGAGAAGQHERGLAVHVLLVHLQGRARQGRPPVFFKVSKQASRDAGCLLLVRQQRGCGWSTHCSAAALSQHAAFHMGRPAGMATEGKRHHSIRSPVQQE